MSKNKTSLGIIGLGYVGLPLAIEFSRKHKVVGFDINRERINQLKRLSDITLEINLNQIDFSQHDLSFTSKPEDLKNCSVYVITVPTPVDKYNKPDLDPLKNASELVSRLLKKDNIVIYESTVYPGCTEEVCVPILTQGSMLQYNKDFFVAYSPERVNPGDKNHKLSDIKKITSGSTIDTAIKVDNLYSEIITAGTYMAESIMVAEAAKVIENTQRDVNIALVNEIAIICNLLRINTQRVLDAAGTKWNFLPFRPGLVGGHCIGVDPYYLTYKAESLGYHPELILSGRRINDSMGRYVATQFIKGMIRKGIILQTAKVLVLGYTFKENCPDIRNTKVIDVINELLEYDLDVDVWDPWVDPLAVNHESRACFVTEPSIDSYDGILIAVAHEKIKLMGAKCIRAFGKEKHLLYDVKSVFDFGQYEMSL